MTHLSLKLPKTLSVQDLKLDIRIYLRHQLNKCAKYQCLILSRLGAISHQTGEPIKLFLDFIHYHVSVI